MPPCLYEIPQKRFGNKGHVAGQDECQLRPACLERGENPADWAATLHGVPPNRSHLETKQLCCLLDVARQRAPSEPQAALVPSHARTESARQDAGFNQVRSTELHFQINAIWHLNKRRQGTTFRLN